MKPYCRTCRVIEVLPTSKDGRCLRCQHGTTPDRSQTRGNPMTQPDDQTMRDFAKRLFSHPAEPGDPLPPSKPAGYVGSEGDNPSPPRDPMRDFVSDLFGADDNARGLHRD